MLMKVNFDKSMEFDQDRIILLQEAGDFFWRTGCTKKYGNWKMKLNYRSNPVSFWCWPKYIGGSKYRVETPFTEAVMVWAIIWYGS